MSFFFFLCGDEQLMQPSQRDQVIRIVLKRLQL
jgi:hypothetical protein